MVAIAVLAMALLPGCGNSSAAPEKIPKKVTVSGVDLGGMTREKAEAALRQAFPDTCETTDMILEFPNRKHTLAPADTKARWEIDSALEQAMAAEEGSQLEIRFSADSDYIRRRIETIVDALGGSYAPSGYHFTGEHPDPGSEEAALPMLVLEKGQPGIDLDVDELCSRILTAYQNNQFRVSVTDVGAILQPEALDVDAIWQEIYIAPQEPSLDRESLTATPGKMGYGFDAEAAKEQLAAAAFGETVTVPCERIAPTISDDEVWFQDVLGRCETPHVDNANRNENLRLACSLLNNKILQPGEILSYNELLGPRTAEKGYKPAPAYSGTDLVDEIGGGICQVSSTWYLSSLLAELHIVSRTNHGFPADYIPVGLDATVNWGTTDLKIQNSYDFPIKITAEVTPKSVIVQILGIETRDYYVRINHVVEGPRYASAYLCHYDPETDKEISRTLDHASLYLDVVWQWPDYADNDRIVTYRTVETAEG